MREKLSMDFAWRFHLDNIEWPVPKHMMYYYLHTKSERAVGPAAASFYDVDWEIVDLPHDYAIAGGVDFSASDTEGFVPRQNGWYRRLFHLDETDMGRRIVLQFDGVATHATVWVNGHLLYRNFCGYTSFQVDITEFVDYGDRLNQISVYVDTKEFEAWWYEGAGIYRHVWLIKTAPVCVDTWGTYVDAKLQKDDEWTVNVEADIRSILYTDEMATVRNRILDDEGTVVCQTEQSMVIAPRTTTKTKTTLSLTKPALWSVQEPNLYTLQTVIEQNGRETDRYDTTFGFRTISYSTNGMLLNGKPIKLKGVCSHEDHANLGVAVPDGIREMRMRILKFMGCNAYRCSHNPPTPEVLELCDRLGIMVMDENRWFDSSEEGLHQLVHMLKRDRNHPCIVMWSMANEEPIQGTERGQNIMHSMRFTAREYDDYRPIMMAMHTGCLDSGGAAGVSDVIGINYQTELFDEIHKKFPETPLVSSEIGGKILNYGVMGDGSGEDWEAVDTRPYFMGMFKWVAFGYRGESRGWPRIYSRSGIIEPTGEPKENTWFYKQMWDDDDCFTKIWPAHWNWPGKEGERIAVKIYANADETELYQNGKSLGRKKINRYRRTEYSVLYMPGDLTAIAYKNGKETTRDMIQTTREAATITLKADRDVVKADRREIIVLTAGVADCEGRAVLWSNEAVHFHVVGPATILAVSNSDPYDAVSATKPSRRIYNGICQLILRTTTEPGEIRVMAYSDGLANAYVMIESKACERLPHVAIETDTDAMYYFAKMDGPN